MAGLMFTARSIEALPANPARQIDYFDESLSGFAIRVSKKGKRSWTLFYRFGGRLRRLTIGPSPTLGLAEARQMARDYQHQIAHGVDPATKKLDFRRAETFEELVNCYLREHARPKKRSWREDERMIERELLPIWKNQKACEISRRDIKALLQAIVERPAPIRANRVLALVRKIFNYAVQEEHLENTPCRLIPAPAPENQRDRFLSSDEITFLWHILANEVPLAQLYLRLILLTAQRPGEILRMRWDQIDFNAGWWTIPKEMAKNKLPHRVPLVGTVKLLLLKHKLRYGHNESVFCQQWLKEPTGELKRGLRQIRKAVGFDFIPRDLRRTAASHMTSMGISRLVVSIILNHKEKGVTAIYDRHSYDPEKREALLRWDEKVAAMVSLSNTCYEAKSG